MQRDWTRHYDEGVPAEIDLEALSVFDFLDRAVARWPDQPAVTFKGKTLRYRELLAQVEHLAGALAELGVQPDSKVSLWMPNLPQMVIAYFAVLRLGAQVVATNPLYVGREIEHQFNDAGVSVVITCDFLWWHRLRPIMSKLPSLQHVVVTGIPDYLPFPLNLLAPLKLKKIERYVRVPREPKVRFFKELIAAARPAPPRPELPPDHIAVLQYTGGTTGLSKGAMLSHFNLAANAQQSLAWFPEIEPGREVGIAVLPYFHSFGMTVALNMPILAGAHIIVIPDPRDIADVVKSVVRYRATALPAVPATYAAICSYPGIDRMDLSSIKACFSGSAPLPLDVMERFEQLTGAVITEGFGLTETSPVTHVNPIKRRKPGSVGVPVPNTEARVVDIETGQREVGIGEEGELCVRGPQVMVGYWNRPDAAVEMIRDGWVYTGDLARLDDDGYCYIVGRKKDMIVAGGYNVYPDEIDQVLFAHPAVAEAASIGVPDERRGETVKSFVVLAPGRSASADEIIAYCKRELAAYKVPTEIEFIDDLPRSPVLKILRRELRDRELAHRSSATD